MLDDGGAGETQLVQPNLKSFLPWPVFWPDIPTLDFFFFGCKNFYLQVTPFKNCNTCIQSPVVLQISQPPHTSPAHAAFLVWNPLHGPCHLANHYSLFKTKLKPTLPESLPLISQARWGSLPAPVSTCKFVSFQFLLESIGYGLSRHPWWETCLWKF